ncbi:hypothetical protein ACFZ8E_24325 [Methylobacterium sp. HMF5984]|uniref:hypothetical protein n=1 Tax=Methylobacterium sp. HMF5984 TaxID=3367370 RepID=UPI0038518FC1
MSTVAERTSQTLLEMEDDIYDVRRWAHLIDSLSSSGSMIDPGALHVISSPVLELAKRLEAGWSEALQRSGGKA